MRGKFRPWVHVTASATGGWRPGEDEEGMRWLWRHLGAHLEGGLAVASMPDHGHHALSPTPDGDQVEDLRNVLRQHSRLFGGPSGWRLHVEPVTTREILWRTVVYVLINPVKDGLATDPYCWLWSTARDLAGAARVPLGDQAALAAALRVPQQELLPRLHERILGHPAYKGERSPAPRQSQRAVGVLPSLPTIANAVLLSERLGPEALARPGAPRQRVVALADEVGQARATELARFLGVSPRTISRYRASPRPDIEAARTCLLNPQLRPPFTRPECRAFGQEVRAHRGARGRVVRKGDVSWWRRLLGG